MSGTSMNKRILIFAGLVLSFILLSAFGLKPLKNSYFTKQLSPEQSVQDAWQLAQRVGVYHFTSEVIQTQYPAPTIANAGREPTEETIYLSGRMDTAQDQLSLTLNRGGENPFDPDSGLEIKVDGHDVYGRVANGEWESVEHEGELFAPNNDLLAYLAGAENVTAGQPETRGGIHYTPYYFDLNGPALAAYIRAQFEQKLKEEKQLPANADFVANDQMKNSSGTGEIWIDQNGLPVRLLLIMDFPPETNGERIEARIKSEFIGFDESALNQTMLSLDERIKKDVAVWLETAVTSPSLILRLQRTGLCLIGAFFVFHIFKVQYKEEFTRPKLVFPKKKKKFSYAIFVIPILLSMVATPVLQAAGANYSQHPTLSFEAPNRKDEVASNSQLPDDTFDPHVDPATLSDSVSQRLPQTSPADLASLQNQTPGNDMDRDGLIDFFEIIIDSDPNRRDTDGDGLIDPLELRLCRDILKSDFQVFTAYQRSLIPIDFQSRPTDSDGDGLTDDLERLLGSDPLKEDSNGDQLTDDQAFRLCVPGQNGLTGDGDLDNDGLNDARELLILGTSAETADSDGDLLPDNVEIAMAFSGDRPYFTDPNQADTNGDGLPDGVECPGRIPPENGLCLDTDGNRIPDFWDRDNDGDGVPDRVDTSPFTFAGSENAPFTHSAPFILSLEGIGDQNIEMDGQEYAKTLFVDLQIRPKNPAHLSYALNVLDWPSDDSTGQITRAPENDSNFYDVLAANGTPSGGPGVDALRNGDLRLVPMLAIEIPTNAAQGQYGNLPIRSDTPNELCENEADRREGLPEWLDICRLAPYDIRVQVLDDSGTLQLYLPLKLVDDEANGGQVAFAARLPYQANSLNWGPGHKIRVEWFVNMLVDRCTSAEVDGRCEWLLDQQEIVHTYPDSWYLTGLSVREDHGFTMATVWEEPSETTKSLLEGGLWQLAYALQSTFLVGRDADGNSERDVKVTDIEDRLGNQDEQRRWGIPPGMLGVSTKAYRDYSGLVTAVTEDTPAILNEQFGSLTDPNPTLLFAREERYRLINLDLMPAGNRGLVSTRAIAGQGKLLHLNADDLDVDVVTTTRLSWAPYRLNNSNNWESYPIEAYWVDLENALANDQTFQNIDLAFSSSDRETIQAGKIRMAQAFYLVMFHGISEQVEIGGDLFLSTEAREPDSELTSEVQEIAETSLNDETGFINKVLEKVAENAYEGAEKLAQNANNKYPFKKQWRSFNGEIISTQHFSKADFKYRALGRAVKGLPSSYYDQFKPSVSGRVVSRGVAGLVLAGAALSIWATSRGGTTGEVVNAAFQGLNLVVATGEASLMAKKFLDNDVNRFSFKENLKSVNGFSRAARFASFVGLTLGVATTWAIFIAQAVALNDTASLQFSQLLAGAIAKTIVAVILFALALIPVVGLILVAFITLIDTVITVVCRIVHGAEGPSEEEEPASFYVCKGIGGLIEEAVKFIIFGQHVMVDLNEENRLKLSPLQPILLAPQQGFVAGSPLHLTTQISNTISLNMEAITEDWKAFCYGYQYSLDTLKSSNFRYALVSAVPVSETMQLQNDPDTLTRNSDFTSQDQLSPSSRFFLGCTQQLFMETLILADVIEEFDAQVTLSDEAATSQNEVRLPDAGINQSIPLYLAEAYAVPVQECWGSSCVIRESVNTNYIDLSDSIHFDVFPENLDQFHELVVKDGGYALAWGQEGDVTFPRLLDADGDGLRNKMDGGIDEHDNAWDFDGDGLSDYAEARLGTDSERGDSDNDGLTDYLEVIYNTDPLRRDSDGDGLSDSLEINGWRCAGSEDIVSTCDNSSRLETWVTADPLEVDTDGDGWLDGQEKTLGLNPRASFPVDLIDLQVSVEEAALPNVLNALSQGKEAKLLNDNYIGPNGSLHYEAQLYNNLANAELQGWLTRSWSIPGTPVIPQAFQIAGNQQRTLSGDFALPSPINSTTQLIVTHTVGSTASNPNEQLPTVPEPILTASDPEKNRATNANLKNGAFTYSAWITTKNTANDELQVILGRYGLARRDVYPTLMLKGERLVFGFSIDGSPEGWRFLETTDLLASNQTYHVAVTFDRRNGAEIFVDGERADLHEGSNLKAGQVPNSEENSIHIGYAEGPVNLTLESLNSLILEPVPQDGAPPEETNPDNKEGSVELLVSCRVNEFIDPDLLVFTDEDDLSQNAFWYKAISDSGSTTINRTCIAYDDSFSVSIVELDYFTCSERYFPEPYVSSGINSWKSDCGDNRNDPIGSAINDVVLIDETRFLGSTPENDDLLFKEIDYSVDKTENLALAGKVCRAKIWANLDPLDPNFTLGRDGEYDCDPSGTLNISLEKEFERADNIEIEHVAVFDQSLSEAQVQSLITDPFNDLRVRDDFTMARYQLEEDGPLYFEDGGAFSLTCDGSSCPLASVSFKGALFFDGYDDQLRDIFSFPWIGRNDTLTFGAWIRPFPKHGRQILLAFYSRVDGRRGPSLIYDPANGVCYDNHKTNTEIICQSLPDDNDWHLVMATVNEAEGKLYVDNQDGVAFVAESPFETTNLTVGSFGDGNYAYRGLMSHLMFFDGALEPETITKLFDFRPEGSVGEFENTWIWQVAQAKNHFTIDADRPTSTLVTDGGYYRGETMMVIQAADPTSGVALLHWDPGSGAWQEPPLCQDSLIADRTWCPLFTPQNGEGVYRLRTQAVDAVGNEEFVQEWQVFVDQTPPEVSLLANALIAPQPDLVNESAWVVHLAGTVQDPDIETGVPGSGVREVAVTLTGFEPQQAVIDGQNNWMIDYQLNGVADPTGSYTIYVAARDNVGADGNQQELSQAVLIDASSPQMTLSGIPPFTAQLGGPNEALSGQIADRYIVTSTQYITATEIIEHPRVISDTVIITDSAGMTTTEVVTETVLVPTAVVVTETLFSTARLPDIAQVAGVDKAEVAFVANTNNAFFVNSQLPPDAVFYLPFDESGRNRDGSQDTFFADYSGHDLAATCHGNRCPHTGLVSLAGQALGFDGQDDFLTIATSSSQVGRDGMTMMAWVRLDEVNNRRTILAAGGDGPFLAVENGRYVAGTSSSLVSTTIPEEDKQGGWLHLAAIYDGDGWTLIRNGRELAELTAESLLFDSNWSIGATVIGDMQVDFFAGGIDEIGLFNRALTVGEIEAFFTAGPVLHLTFDQPTITGGHQVLDHSGLGNHGLISGSPSSMAPAALGHVGPFALHIEDDTHHLLIPNSTALNAEGALTFAAWVRQSGNNRAATILSKNGSYAWGISDGRMAVGFVTANGEETDKIVGPILPFSEWVHLALTWQSGGQVIAYVNGEPVWQETAPTIGLRQTDSDITIGLTNGLSQLELDDLRLYQRALTGVEIEGLVTMAWQTADLIDPAGGEQAKWSLPLPADLEGFYEVALRGSDTLGNVGNDIQQRSYWRGFIDTRSPQIEASATISGSGATARTYYDILVRDINLNEATISYPCERPKLEHTNFNSLWFRSLTGQTPVASDALFEIAATCLVRGHQTELPTIQACDTLGNCTAVLPEVITAVHNPTGFTSWEQPATSPIKFVSDSRPAVAKAPPLQSESPALDVVIFQPHDGQVIPDRREINLSGGVIADASPITVTLLVDGQAQIIDGDEWAGTGVIDAEFAYVLDPFVDDGRHTLQILVEDSRQETALSNLVEIWVDTIAPTLSLDREALTLEQMNSAGLLLLSGTIQDDSPIDRLEVTIGDESPHLATIDGERWTLYWDAGLVPPNGNAYPLRLFAINEAGHEAVLETILTVDIVPPSIEDLVVTAGGNEYQPGPIRLESPSPLTAVWQNKANAMPYELIWSGERKGVVRSESFLIEAGQLSQSFMPDEAEKVFATLIGRDAVGNETQAALGPFYFDSPETPDYIQDLTYYGWLESGASLIGINREEVLNDRSGTPLGTIQQLYTSWDEEYLRLTWTGADWRGRGDLYYYFDVTAGGSNQAFDPYTTESPSVQLPVGFIADYLVWIRDEDAAQLLSWTEQGWRLVTEMNQENFQINGGRQPLATDLLLPFDLLGMEDPSTSSLGLLAFASEEDQLRLWAMMPHYNPVNSSRVTHPSSTGYLGQALHLQHAYFWESMGGGQRPNADLFEDSDLQVTLTAEPQGMTVGYRQYDLIDLFQPGGAFPETAVNSLVNPPLPLAVQPATLSDEQNFIYTITLTNQGSETATNVTLNLEGTNVNVAASIDVGEVAPGETLTIPVAVTVPAEASGSALGEVTADLIVTIEDQVHGELDWLWARHPVSQAPEKALLVSAPIAYVLPITETIRGFVPDDAGASLISIEIEGVNEDGDIIDRTMLECPDSAQDNTWSCPWPTQIAEGIAAYHLTVSAVEAIGDQRERPTTEFEVAVDREPPELSVFTDLESNTINGFLNGSELRLAGEVRDNFIAESVRICLTPNRCEMVSLNNIEDEGRTGIWEYTLPLSNEDGSVYDLTVEAIDIMGNHSPVFEQRIWFDDVPPAITVTSLPGTVLLANHFDHAAQSLLTGTYADGGGLAAIQVQIQTPSRRVTLPLNFSQGNWLVNQRLDQFGEHLFHIVATDLAGNNKTYGPYSVQIEANTSEFLISEVGHTGTDGAFIALEVENGLQGLWSTVQWENEHGDWFNVDGWHGYTDHNGRVLWWLQQSDLGKGPFRWLLYNNEGGHVIAISQPFYLPDQRLHIKTIKLDLVN